MRGDDWTSVTSSFTALCEQLVPKNVHMWAEGRPEDKLPLWSCGDGGSRRLSRESAAAIIQIAEGVLIKRSKTEPRTWPHIKNYLERKKERASDKVISEQRCIKHVARLRLVTMTPVP